jgi:hypothetical protein
MSQDSAKPRKTPGFLRFPGRLCDSRRYPAAPDFAPSRRQLHRILHRFADRRKRPALEIRFRALKIVGRRDQSGISDPFADDAQGSLVFQSASGPMTGENRWLASRARVSTSMSLFAYPSDSALGVESSAVALPR